MLVLLGFAAIAVDSGLKFDERRQEQGGVDAGTLSAGIGAQVSPTQPGCGSFANVQRAACNGAVVAMSIINKNADAAYPIAAFDNPTLCPDSAFAAEYRPGGSNQGILSPVNDGGTNRTLDCLRWNENMSKVRVILPITPVNTTFGRVLNVNFMNVNAIAEAEASLKRPGQLIPFAVGPTGGAANMGCLYEPTPGQTFPPCDGPVEGNFGYMRPYLYGDVVIGTPTTCTPQADNIAATFAKGADHIYALNVSVPGTANDRDNCPNKNQLIDEIDVETGASANAVTQGGLGLIYGTEGRLRCKDGDAAEPAWISPTWSSAACEAVNSNLPETVDDTPLWTFISSGAAAESGGACNGSISNKAAMQSCLVAWRAFGTHTTSLFTSALATSPRFAWVPRTNIDPSTGGSGFYTIEEFLPVYIQTLYLKCNASGPSCDVVFDPGETSTGNCTGTLQPCGFPSSGNKNLDAMSAFILRTSMLPFPLDQFPGAPGQLLYNLSE
jgi:hypothetical protein